MTLRLFIVGALAAALIQTAALGQIVYERAALLRGGTEVMLRSRFVDPRDLFRGHYVILNLDVGALEVDTIPVDEALVDAGEPVFIELKKGEEPFWVAAALHAQIPVDATGPVVAGEYRGTTAATADRPASHRVELPFDRYFAPKLRARELETIQNDDKLGVVLAVGKDGRAAIKGIVVDGAVLYEEPLL